MKKKLLSTLLILIVSASATAFTPAAAKPETPKRSLHEPLKNRLRKDREDPETAVEAPEVHYTYQDRPYVLENAAGDTLATGNCFRIDLDAKTARTFPKLADWADAYNDDAAKSISDTIRDTAGDAYEMSEGGWLVPFETEVTFTPTRADAAALSFAEGTYTYLGGAHGYQSYRCFNIDPGTGRDILFYDVFAETEELPDILFREILTQNRDFSDWFDDLLEDEDSLQDSMEWKNFSALVRSGLNKTPADLAWALDYDGVWFYFNDYSLGSYAAGAQSCKLTFEKYPSLFTGKYRTEETPDLKKIAAPEKPAAPEILHLYAYDAVSAYNAFLSSYMDALPAIRDPESEEDVPEDPEYVRINVIFLDDDDIPELAVANADGPGNPVHLYSFNPEHGEVCLDGSFSMYGKMYYEEKTGFFIPMYYLPAGNGEVLRYENGEYETEASWSTDYSDDTENYSVNGKKSTSAEVSRICKVWNQHPFRPVFSEFHSISLQDVLESDRTLIRAAGLDPIGKTLDGVWESEYGEFRYLETDGEEFAVFDENGFAEYMGVIEKKSDTSDISPFDEQAFEFSTMDGGYFGTAVWTRADDPLNDMISLRDQFFTRYDTTGAGSPVRSPGAFLMTDITFLGEHPAQGSSAQGTAVQGAAAQGASAQGAAGKLTIDQANVQTGGYEITIDFGNGITAHGYANPTLDGTLSFYCDETEGDGYFSGEISNASSPASSASSPASSSASAKYELTITNSGSEDIPEGSVFRFKY